MELLLLKFHPQTSETAYIPSSAILQPHPTKCERTGSVSMLSIYNKYNFFVSQWSEKVIISNPISKRNLI